MGARLRSSSKLISIKNIFDETPLNRNEINSSNLFILNSNGEELSQSDKNRTKYDITNLESLLEEQKNFKQITSNDKKLLVGHAQSSGYEGFMSGWHSIIIQT